jgi:hypothetical protein
MFCEGGGGERSEEVQCNIRPPKVKGDVCVCVCVREKKRDSYPAYPYTDPRPRFHISQNVESGQALSKNKVGSMSGHGGGERAIVKNVDVKRIGFVNAASSNP